MTTIMSRLLAKVNVDEESGCWNWQWGKNKKGYGRLSVNGIAQLAHRLIYKETYGEFDKKLFVCHHCDNPGCCNPEHLFLGTNTDNIRDASRKGRMAHGDNHYVRRHPENRVRGSRIGAAVLTEDKVLAIRMQYDEGGVTKRELGKLYGVHETTILALLRRDTWTHV